MILPESVRDGKPSVLIVDDHLKNLELLEAVFERHGFLVYPAPDAYTAVELFETKEMDLALLDVMMPGMNGYELCKVLKDISGMRFFPVILLTALSEKRSKIVGLECGADDFITKPFDIEELIVKARSLVRLKQLHADLEHSENIILALVTAMESNDPFTRGHSDRVGTLAENFSAFLGFGRKEQAQIRKAGILHDVGKISLSTSVLCKKENLTTEDVAIIRSHPVVGEEICRPLVSMRDILPAIRNHHERWAGQGFPDGLEGEQIPLFARILSISDSFDAMTSRRPYREKIGPGLALEVIREEKHKGQWDPKLVDPFISMVKEVGLERFCHA